MFADNIVWDIDLEEGETYESARAELELPKCVELPKWLWPEYKDDIEGYPPYYDEEISDWLSNEYGFCVVEFTLS